MEGVVEPVSASAAVAAGGKIAASAGASAAAGGGAGAAGGGGAGGVPLAGGKSGASGGGMGGATRGPGGPGKSGGSSGGGGGGWREHLRDGLRDGLRSMSSDEGEDGEGVDGLDSQDLEGLADGDGDADGEGLGEAEGGQGPVKVAHQAARKGGLVAVVVALVLLPVAGLTAAGFAVYEMVMSNPLVRTAMAVGSFIDGVFSWGDVGPLDESFVVFLGPRIHGGPHSAAARPLELGAWGVTVTDGLVSVPFDGGHRGAPRAVEALTELNAEFEEVFGQSLVLADRSPSSIHVIPDSDLADYGVMGLHFQFEVSTITVEERVEVVEDLEGNVEEVMTRVAVASPGLTAEQGEWLLEHAVWFGFVHLPVSWVEEIAAYQDAGIDLDTSLAPGVVVGLDGWTRPALGPVTSRYGAPRDGGRRRHLGTDLGGGGCGGPIWAANAGVVTFAGHLDNFAGIGIVRIDHGGGVVTQYLHSERGDILVHVGQHVDSGEVIARVGNSGISFGCHLHFDVVIGGTHVDPEPWMAARGVILGQ